MGITEIDRRSFLRSAVLGLAGFSLFGASGCKRREKAGEGVTITALGFKKKVRIQADSFNAAREQTWRKYGFYLERDEVFGPSARRRGLNDSIILAYDDRRLQSISLLFGREVVASPERGFTNIKEGRFPLVAFHNVPRTGPAVSEVTDASGKATLTYKVVLEPKNPKQDGMLMLFEITILKNEKYQGVSYE